MLFHLLYPLHSEISALNVFRYITFRTAGASLTALVIGLFVGPMMIRTLREFQIGQVVRQDGPATHRTKAGTPTMGGLLILTSALVPTLLWADLTNPFIWIAVLATAAFGAVMMGELNDVDSEVVVFQRPLSRFVVAAIDGLQQRGIKVVVELDDNFACIPPANPAWHILHPKRSPNHNWTFVAEAARIADWVVVSTPALAQQYGKHGRVTVVPNFVPAHYLDIERPANERPIVGWAGRIITHPGDLRQVGHAVESVMRQADFKIVGDDAATARSELGLSRDPLAVEWAEYDRYPHEVASFDVGIAPLADNKFAHAKSRIKALEYMALGVVPVMSPLPDYRTLGFGFFARRPREWGHHLNLLTSDADHLASMQAAARAHAAAFTVEANAEQFWDAWTAPLR